MASLDISIPPRTHCSAARSCGGVRSNSPPRGASSATLMTLTSPSRGRLEEPPRPRSTPVIANDQGHDQLENVNSTVVSSTDNSPLGSPRVADSLLRPAACVQSLCAQVCGQP